MFMPHNIQFLPPKYIENWIFFHGIPPVCIARQPHATAAPSGRRLSYGALVSGTWMVVFAPSFGSDAVAWMECMLIKT